jgi:hypothetical protein
MQVYLGVSHVNNPKRSDVTFTVDGEPFYGHRIQLEAASGVFDAMFNGGYKELRPNHPIEIPNIRRPVFEAMMRCVYTGTVEVAADIAQVSYKPHDSLYRCQPDYRLRHLRPFPCCIVCHVLVTTCPRVSLTHQVPTRRIYYARRISTL